MTERELPGGSKTQLVYEYVIKQIVEGAWPGGTPLNIGLLAEETGVSLIPTREALRRLESEGLVEFLFHRGVRVVELTSETYLEIMQTQAALEGLAVSLSAPHLTSEDVERALSENQLMNEAYAAYDFNAYNAHSAAFHGILRMHCPNQYLLGVLDRGQHRVAAVQSAAAAYQGEIAGTISDEHIHLLHRITAGASPTEIDSLMRAHRETTIQANAARLAREATDALTVS